MNQRAFQIIVFALLGMIILPGCAGQQDILTLDNRLSVVEERSAATEQRSLQFDSRIDEYIKNGEDLRERSAGQNVLIDQLRGEIRVLWGKLEETEYLLKQKIKAFEDSKGKQKKQLDRIEQMISANMDRIVHIELYLNLETTKSELKLEKEPQTTSDIPSKEELSAGKIYKSAKQAFAQSDFETAREEFQQLLQLYPQSPQADNAQFWLGETYYREKWYEKAILEYQKVIEKYPKGNKVPASLLKQGFAFSSLGDQANTRLILTELVKKYPESNEAKIAKQKLKRLKP
ncbi:MAG: tol-pal system protein YbgF [Desulfobacterales bacterium]|uniref:Tol-pal system protein YbgF n=1 Tax=Candidatus Desulfatibia vada TaxID=2841696 RepID=A0A8J6TMP9_9BACT|nr:tol-pal system protein YbgF [Candidatus Desulfatibia vada]